jgi:hypothetical protein
VSRSAPPREQSDHEGHRACGEHGERADETRRDDGDNERRHQERQDAEAADDSGADAPGCAAQVRRLRLLEDRELAPAADDLGIIDGDARPATDATAKPERTGGLDVGDRATMGTAIRLAISRAALLAAQGIIEFLAANAALSARSGLAA